VVVEADEHGTADQVKELLLLFVIVLG